MEAPAQPPEAIVKPQADDLGAATDNNIILLITRIFIIFGGIIPFIPQYLQIYRAQSASGFSMYVCLVVIASNVLRIAYWFGHWFDNALLFQSIIMTLVMLALIELCLRVERNRAVQEGRKFQEVNLVEKEFNPDKFWQWTDIWSYVQASMILFVVSVVYTTSFKEIEYMIEPVGFIALIVESTLGLPQIIANYQKQSTAGMNIFMVLLWTMGDAIKGYFFFTTMQPLPFRICASIQLCFDAILFLQVLVYYGK